EKTVEEMAVEVSKRGYAFAQVHPQADRNDQARLINLVYAVDEGPRAYIERINIRGNARTRDYVIRREFDIAEGDAFNRALIDRAERHLKALAYFKTVKIATEPGSAPDRVVVDVDLEEQETGDFTFGIGYSTVDGVVGNVSIGDRNFLGLGQTVKTSLTLGQYSKAFDVGFVAPYFLGSGLSFGADLYGKQSSASSYQSQGTPDHGM